MTVMLSSFATGAVLGNPVFGWITVTAVVAVVLATTVPADTRSARNVTHGVGAAPQAGAKDPWGLTRKVIVAAVASPGDRVPAQEQVYRVNAGSGCTHDHPLPDVCPVYCNAEDVST
jgi:hypothetical protein